MVEALQWDSVMKEIKEVNRLWWKSPWYCLQRWKSGNCIEQFRTHLHCHVFLGFIKGSQFNDWQKCRPGSQEGGGKCSMLKPTEPSYCQNRKQAHYCQGFGKLRLFYLLLLYPWFSATYIPSVHLVSVVFSFDVYALFFNALTQCFQMEMCVAFLKNLGKTFFPQLPRGRQASQARFKW